MGLSYYNSQLNDKVNLDEKISLEVPKNSSISKIISIFNEKDLLKPDWFFTTYLKVTAKLESKYIYAGIYDIEPEMTNKEVIEKLFKGGYAKTIKVTFPEGLNNKEIAKIAHDSLKIDTNIFLKLCRSDSLLDARGIPADNIIGYLMPETYQFHGNESGKQLIDKFLNEQEAFWNNLRLTLIEESRLNNKYQILTLASIVQAESPLESEMDTVAGLYLNRLKIGMALQADPTVQFALNDKKRLTYKDLKVQDPYNTYVNQGLPPGPINNPGKAAINACLSPADHDYLYMVAYGDGSGRHYFSKSLEEHNRYVRKYRRNRDRR